MKITRIDTFAVGATWKNLLFVKVHTDAGIHGVGEGTLNGFIRATEATVRELEHLVIGEDPRRINALSKKLMDSVSLDAGHASFWLEGEKLRGGWTLHRTGAGRKPQWLLIKRRDEGADARRNPQSTQPRSVKSGRTLQEVAREGAS